MNGRHHLNVHTNLSVHLLHVLGEEAPVAAVSSVGTVVGQLAVSRMQEHGRLVLLASLLHRQRLWAAVLVVGGGWFTGSL